MEENNQSGAQPQNQESESSTRSQSQTGDPGRTPGKAEGEDGADADDSGKLGNSDTEQDRG